MPSAGQSCSPTARTVSNKAASSPGWPQAAIQLAESRTSERRRTSAAAMLVIASPIAMRPEAGASSRASGVRSPMDMASPRVSLEPRQRHGGIGHRDLPGTDHLVAARQPADGAVADGHEEGLVGHCRQPQETLQRLRRIHCGRIEIIASAIEARHVAQHARRLAQQHVHRQVHRLVAQEGIGDAQHPVAGGLADHGIGTALAPAEGLEDGQPVRRDGEHIALLRLVAPDLERRHARLVVRYRAQVDATAAVAVCNGLRHCVGQATGSHVVHQQDRVLLAERGTAVDDLLRPALDLRVAALHRGEVEFGRAAAAADRGRGAAPQTDEHGRAAEHDQRRPGRDLFLLDMLPPQRAEATCDHDRLVVTAQDGRIVSGCTGLEAAEVTEHVRPAELVIEGRRPDGPLEHDRQRRGDALRPPRG